MRAAYEGDMDHALQNDVVNIRSTALHQTRRIRARYGLADIAIGTVGIAERRVHVIFPALRARATVDMASTMASYPVQRQ